MKELSLKIDMTGLKLSGDDKSKTPVELVSIVIQNIVLSWAASKRGLSESDRRKFYKIVDLLEKAVEEKLESIELEDSWWGFLRKCKREGTMMPDKLLRRVETLIDDVKDD